ncbi:Fucoxanthin-chlorophyll a-c binding protein F, chloroplastic [Symbiodinium microadriaticum]|uniref:Fucoxanthin-chlorophyll a-c binding protein F, chloroplastic n=2 Tax=Symbiodinium TaxID=2949 RepID=A0A1Q9CM18_SYMMI|nr:Fucoxanthin-chlorophyll a-c binding protein F, chloroplastic [Symbiodinium microadriaticum]
MAPQPMTTNTAMALQLQPFSSAFALPNQPGQGHVQSLRGSSEAPASAHSTAPMLGSGVMVVSAAVAAVGMKKSRATKKSMLRASPEEIMFKGGMGSVSGGTGAGSFTASSGSSSSSSSSSSASVATTGLGVQAPVGFWDPLGLSKGADAATMKRRRAVEIKHGRVAMYATIGYIVPEYYKFPGYLSPSLSLKFSDVPNGLAAISKVPVLGWLQILWFIGLVEGSGFFSGKYGLGFMKDATMDGTPGDYGVGFPTFIGKVSDPASKTTKLSAELANGRLAMMAIIGMFFQDGLTGSAWGDWALYTDSPLRAEETEEKAPPPFDPAQQVGALPPLGFFDPAGFSKVGDEVGFKNLRAAEIKHGRVAMMAALGGVVQHYVKFPGFDSVPAGMGAVTTAPGTYGFVALFLASGAMELAVWTEDPSKEAGNFGDPAGLGQYNEEMRNKELNNGRFAMFAALGIIAADLATGKDAMQQFGL